MALNAMFQCYCSEPKVYTQTLVGSAVGTTLKKDNKWSAVLLLQESHATFTVLGHQYPNGSVAGVQLSTKSKWPYLVLCWRINLQSPLHQIYCQDYMVPSSAILDHSSSHHPTSDLLHLQHLCQWNECSSHCCIPILVTWLPTLNNHFLCRFCFCCQ